MLKSSQFTETLEPRTTSNKFPIGIEICSPFCFSYFWPCRSHWVRRFRSPWRRRTPGSTPSIINAPHPLTCTLLASRTARFRKADIWSSSWVRGLDSFIRMQTVVALPGVLFVPHFTKLVNPVISLTRTAVDQPPQDFYYMVVSPNPINAGLQVEPKGHAAVCFLTFISLLLLHAPMLSS